jgi:hypothetical protein
MKDYNQCTGIRVQQNEIQHIRNILADAFTIMANTLRNRRAQSYNQVQFIILGVISLVTSMLFAATCLAATPAQTALAQQGQPPFMESGRSPIKGQTLAAPGENSMEVTSSGGDVIVTAIWKPLEIGKPNNFSFQFADIYGNIISPTYSVQLMQGIKTIPGTLREGQTSPQQQYTFNQTGIYTLKINNIQNKPANDVINIPLQVNATTTTTSTANTTNTNTTTGPTTNTTGNNK